MADIYNDESNTLISGTSAVDSILNYGHHVTISTGNGSDTVDNIYDSDYDGEDEDNKIYSADNVSINTGAGNDSVYNNGGSVTINTGAGNDYVYNEGAAGTDIKINGEAGFDTIISESENTTIDGGSDNDEIYSYGASVSINGNSGNDTIYSDIGGSDESGPSITITGGSGDDLIDSDSPFSIIDGGTGNDDIVNYGWETSINGGAGNDVITNYNSFHIEGSNVTINGGKGNDRIHIENAENNLIQYSNGDGNDIIYGFKADSTLSISGDSYSTTKSGDDVIVTVGNGKISFIGAADYFSADNIAFTKTAETNTWKLNGTTATYGTSSKTLITVNGVKSTSGLSVNDKVVTVKKASVNATKITISDGYTLKLGDDVSVPSTNKSWSLNDTTATYKQTTSAGYKLASDSKSITYSKSSSKTLATVKGVKSIDGLKVSSKTITVSASALGTSKVTVSDGYTLKLGSDVTKSKTTSKGWTLNNSTATYKAASTTAGYKLANNQITYVKASGGSTLASVKGAASTSGLSVSGKKITLKKSALKSKVTLGGSYEFNLATGDYKKTSIMGSAKADTITVLGKNLSINGGAGNDTINIYGTGTTVTGGNGKDVFVYNGGNVKITDLGTTDTLKIGDGTGDYSTVESGKNIIVTVGDNKITLVGAASLSKLNIAGTTDESTDNVIVSGKKVKLTENYIEESFALVNKYSTIQTVDASAVQLPFYITGNNLKNNIIGSSEDDTINGASAADIIKGGDGNDCIIGGTGNDTLTGGKDSDVFVWNKGDGNDLITDYMEEDKILIKGDSVKSFTADSDDLIFNLASGSKITVAGGAYEIINYTDSKGNHTHSHYVKFTNSGKSASLDADYSKTSFEPTNYEKYSKVLATINASALTHGINIVGNSVANSIFGSGQNDTIDGGYGADTILGSKGNDSLFGNEGNDYLHGGVGADTLWGGAGDDWLDGGDGKDVFLYKPGEGNDRIFNYDSNFDTIKLLSGTVDNAESAGNDIIFTIGEGSIIINDASYAKIVDSSGTTLKEYSFKTKS